MTNSLHDKIIAAAREADLTVDLVEFDRELDFYTQGLDSLDHVQILMKVEETFGMRFADTDFDECNSIDRIAAFLQRSAHGGA